MPSRGGPVVHAAQVLLASVQPVYESRKVPPERVAPSLRDDIGFESVGGPDVGPLRRATGKVGAGLRLLG
jgi:hypothetical protein